MVFLILLFFLVYPHNLFAASDISIADYSSGSDTEWVLITNNTDNNINIQNWVIRDENDNSKTVNSIILSGCISAKSSQVFTHNKGWLNDTADSIYLYDTNLVLIDKLSYSIEKNTNVPVSSNTCLLPTSTPAPTLAPTSTPTPTNTPTPDPTIINPESGISINEFMPYGSTSDKEWVELFNNKDQPVKLIAWKIMDSNSGTRSFDLFIGAKSYGVVEFSSGFLNNDGDKVILINNNGKEMDNREYSGNNYSLDYSWSLVSGSWCRAEISKGTLNNQNCYLVPTSIPTSGPTATPTTDPTKYTTDESATESAIIEPKSESSFITPEISSEPSPNITSSLVLGDSTSSATTPKKNYLPLILIIVGGILLVSPTIITKIKLKK